MGKIENPLFLDRVELGEKNQKEIFREYINFFGNGCARTAAEKLGIKETTFHAYLRYQSKSLPTEIFYKIVKSLDLDPERFIRNRTTLRKIRARWLNDFWENSREEAIEIAKKAGPLGIEKLEKKTGKNRKEIMKEVREALFDKYPNKNPYKIIGSLSIEKAKKEYGEEWLVKMIEPMFKGLGKKHNKNYQYVIENLRQKIKDNQQKEERLKFLSINNNSSDFVATEKKKPVSSYEVVKKGNRWKLDLKGKKSILDIDYTIEGGGSTYEGRILFDPQVEKIFRLNSKGLNSDGEALEDISINIPLSDDVSVNFSVKSRKYEEPPKKPPEESPLETVSVTKSPESEIKQYTRFSKSVKYFPKLEELVTPDGLITNSDIDDNFENPNDRRGAKQALIHLSKKETEPVKRIDGDYKILDKNIFSKILEAVNLSKRESKNGTIILTESAKKYIKTFKDEGLLTPTKTTVTYEEISKIIKRREERIGLSISLRALERDGRISIKGKGKERKYVFDPGIASMEISPEEIPVYEPTPLGGKKFIEHALALREKASRNLPIDKISENDFKDFFEERFGENAGFKIVGSTLRNRLLRENYIIKIDHVYRLTNKFQDLSLESSK